MDEVPAYLPVGQGPHLYLRVEKRGRTTRDVVRALALALHVEDRDAGYAGQKDKEAVTTQWLSFPVAHDPDPQTLAGPGLRVLEVSRHGNKLRTGHVRANRFDLAVRGGDLEKASACAFLLMERGFPNFFGPQRFGVANENAAGGRSLIKGENSPETRRRARDRFLKRFCISAYQSLLFNRWLEERISEGLFASALEGDVMKKLDSGGLFDCVDPSTDTPRVERFEISPAGPMFGSKLRPAAGEAKGREDRLLEKEGVTLSDFARGGGEAEGTRRAARLKISLELLPLETGEGYRTRFELPKGSYATVVMRELMKSEAVLPEEEG